MKRRVLNINSDEPEVDDQVIDSWLKKFEFWYELLPNEIFEECVLYHDRINPPEILSSFEDRLRSGSSLPVQRVESIVLLVFNIFLWLKSFV